MRFSFRTFLSLFVVVFSVFAMVCGSAEGLDAPEARSLGKASSAAQWTWMHGSNSVNAYGSYGTLGESSATTTPGARRGAATWRDATGALWLFGGFGYGASGGTGYLNDLWKFDPASGRWTWIKGSSSINQPGVYGTQGVAATGNRPGGRVDAVTWFDESGRLWLFGGTGYGSTTQHLLNDLWRYDPDSGNWAWMKGRSNAEQAGVYGELGEAGETNTPGSRRGAVSWTDGADVFWIFGGYGIDENSQMGALNDVWKYDCSTGDWTWMKGAKQFNQKGQYGTQGVAESGSTPGGRSYAVAWKETLGTVWLFSGLGYDSAATRGYLNDLWAYDSSTNTWTWMKGPSISGQPGVYGELGVPAADNSPGGRSYAANWLDESGELWLFGGYGHDRVTDEAYLNDLWRLDTSTLTWTWMKGKALVNSVGTYGTKGTAALANTPGSRMYGVSWADTSGALWLFGGTGYGRTATPGLLNDLWRWADAQLPAYTVTFQTDDTEGAALIGVTSQTIVHGQNATPVSAEAPASHHFVRWSKGGAPYSTANPLTVTNVTAAMTLVANFAINLYSLKYTAGEHGVIQGTAEQWVNHGSSGSSVLAEAMPGYHFVTWSDGLLSAERIDTDVTASIDVTAEFAINQYTLSYSIQEHGTLIGLATQTVSHGDNGVPVTASAETGYHFVRWSDGVTENPRAEQNVTSDMSVSAEIGINQYALNYATEGDGSISGDTAQSVAYGGSGTAVTAVPGLGSHFVSWSDGSTANPRIDVNITEALSVAAVFALNEYALVYAAGPNGTISGPVNQTVAHGSSGAAVCAVPDPGYKFTLWSDGCASASRADQNVTGNIQVEAYFEIDVPPVIPVGRWTDLVLMFGFGILAVWRLIRARTNLSDGIKRGGW